MIYNCDIVITVSVLNIDTTTTFTDGDCDTDVTTDMEIVLNSESPKKKMDKNILQTTRKNIDIPKKQKKDSAKSTRGKMF